MSTTPTDVDVGASAPSSLSSCTLQLRSVACELHLYPYALDLRAAFGTSHSSSTRRSNALLRVQIGSVNGWGEAGLPPKKTGCYEATLDSLRAQTDRFGDFCRDDEHQINDNTARYDPIAHVTNEYFQGVRRDLAQCDAADSQTSELAALRHLFWSLDTFLTVSPPSATDAAFRCLVEVTLFEVWGRMRGELVCEMIGARFDSATVAALEPDANTASSITDLPFSPRQPRSFYTVGMDSLDQMLQNLEFGLTYTPLIKVKVGTDIDTTREVLARLVSRMHSAVPNGSWRISIDANAAWSTPECALDFLEVVAPYAEFIAMVEQPFPLFRACPAYIDANRPHACMQVIADEYVDLPPSVMSGWAGVAESYAARGLQIYADESICTVHDLVALRSLLHGINVKLEKAGGYRGALALLHAASTAGVATWLGCMVGSSLNSTQAAHLLPHAVPDCWGDLDGALLTRNESDRFRGGMRCTHAQDGEPPTGELRIERRAAGGCGVVEKDAETSATRRT